MKAGIWSMIRWIAGVGLLIFAVVSLGRHGTRHPANALLAALVGAFLLVRGYLKDREK